MNYPQLASPELSVSTSLSSFLAKPSVDFCRFFTPSYRILLVDGVELGDCATTKPVPDSGRIPFPSTWVQSPRVCLLSRVSPGEGYGDHR